MAFTRAAENLAGAKALTTARQQIRAATIFMILTMMLVLITFHLLTQITHRALKHFTKRRLSCSELDGRFWPCFGYSHPGSLFVTT